MSSFTPIQNMKSFFIYGPPSVIFTLCVAIFAVVAFVFACLINGNMFIRDPMETTDWNMFLSDVSKNEFCLSGAHDTKTQPFSFAQNQTSDLKVLLSVSAVFSLYWSSTQNLNVSAILGQIMHIKSDIDYDANVAVGFNFIGDRNISRCLPESSTCQVNQGACVTFYGPKSIFPKTQMPPSCAPAFYQNSYETYTSRSLLKTSTEVINSSMLPGGLWCANGITLRMKYQPDPDLNIMLSLHEHSIINLHLMYTFYFLLVMVISIFVWVSFRGRGKLSDKVSFEKLPTSA